VGGPRVVAARFEPVPGMVVADKYRVERTLGEGGMGLVVAATHLGLEQHVAIKFLLPEAVRNKVAVERFLREARVAAKVRSEYVARVHDVGTLDNGVPYIVMEHLEGSDLGKLISRGGPLPVGEACEMALQACEALAEVHAAGIVHRDLKPSNLFVTRRADGAPAVKLLDFGISKLTQGGEDSSQDPGLTATTTIMGSPSYMSPEQLKSTKEVDPRTDVWSLGAVLFEALAGKQAFRGESLPQVCAMIASEDPPLLSSMREDIPLALERAVRGCLEKDPNKRISLVDLAGALAEFVPERAKPCLERIEATLGTQAVRPAENTPLPKEPLVAALATAERAGASSSEWPQERRQRRSGGGLLFLFVIVVAGVLGIGLYAGGDKVLRGRFASATSAVTSAASAVSSVANLAASAAGAAASAVASSVASSLPPIPSALTTPFEDPSASTGVETDEVDEPEPSAASSMAGASHPAAAPPKPGAPKAHPTKPRHGKLHRRHY
jgi:tRNA A-37 threonylcarbamoyl transferase component Bud32